MADLIFYTNPQSRGQIVRWMLEEVGAPYETRSHRLRRDDEERAYLAINPMGKVPAIEPQGQGRDRSARRSAAYLADVFPEANLAPPTDERADYYRWMFFAVGPGRSGVQQPRRLAGSRRRSGSGCSAMAITTSPSHAREGADRPRVYRRRPFHRRRSVRRSRTSSSCSRIQPARDRAKPFVDLCAPDDRPRRLSTGAGNR